jgi:predicted small lipoprotein YifL
MGVGVLRDRRRVALRLMLVGVLVAALGLSACGRKGSLEAPGAAATVGDQPAKAENQRNKPDRPFFLDGLL